MKIAQIENISPPPAFTNFKFKGNPDYFYTRDFLGIVVSRLLTFAIIGSGLFFFVRLISAGYSYLTNAGDQNKIQSASKELLNAVIGLLLIISSYFIIQAIQVIFGIKIL